MTSSDDFSLRFWDPKSFNNVLTLLGHTKPVMDAIEIKKPYCIATAALDGKIYLWKLGKLLEP